MIFGSVCSGIEAASVAWHPLGWRAAFLSEIDPNPRAVLAHHYPDVPLRGDFTEIRRGDHESIDLLVGGTPCQSFSVAGLRQGLDDARGQLSLQYAQLADRLRPRWLVWENVPGVLSKDKGRAFGSILGALVECGYGVAYRVLDAQFIQTRGFRHAVPQRRARVILVGYLGDWRPAAAVLSDPESLSGYPAPRRQSGQGVAHDAAQSLTASGRGVERVGETRGQDPVIAVHAAEVAPALNAHFREKQGLEDQHMNGGGGSSLPPVSMCLNAGAMGRIDAESETLIPTIGAVFDWVVPFDTTQITSAENRSQPRPGDPCHPLLAGAHAPCIAFHGSQDPDVSGDVTHPLGRNNGLETCVAIQERPRPAAQQWAVRRLTPLECERLQGFPDGYTLIDIGRARTVKPDMARYLRSHGADVWADNRGRLRTNAMADGPRYKMLGNSMAINVLELVGERIQAVDDILSMRITAKRPPA